MEMEVEMKWSWVGQISEFPTASHRGGISDLQVFRTRQRREILVGGQTQTTTTHKCLSFFQGGTTSSQTGIGLPASAPFIGNMVRLGVWFWIVVCCVLCVVCCVMFVGIFVCEEMGDRLGR